MMGKVGFVLNGVLLAGVLTVLFLGSEGVAAPLLDVESVNQNSSDLALLESSVAADPQPANVAALASRYLDHGQPGLAQGALDQFQGSDDAQLTHVRSRVAFAQGHTVDALALSRESVASCEATASRCPNWVLARALRQTEILEAMLAAGIEDPALDPARTQAAVDSAMREVRLVAER